VRVHELEQVLLQLARLGAEFEVRDYLPKIGRPQASTAVGLLQGRG
jgi:hypothetical protein